MKYKKIQLTALDWYSYNNQDSIDEDYPVGTVEIVGFLIKEDKQKVVVAMEIFTSHNNDLRKVMSIPKGCIIKRKYLK